MTCGFVVDKLNGGKFLISEFFDLRISPALRQVEWMLGT
eukprot:CAMPEP_0203762650 /NCGR_PEP_ID=MMETSP0098-20131031/15488_1 /ASSEMBLY_ACC=CAM_ASM_000208 /TAXON_ID=96639 /ORGANISM=" , Strain NY0313808BC1" /LENGTH=38 /DNA_ID= /DNA_START= /DNA_END= /DNA_ORIENTATION=